MSTTASGFYVTGGTLRQDAPSYVERQADKELYVGLLRGQFCYVLTARQMGKSSLMVHTAARLREEGVTVAILDLTAIGQNLSPEQWYGGLLSHLGPDLGLEDELDDFWLGNPQLGPLQRWIRALQEVVLARCPGRIVVFIDEIDAVRSLSFSTDEFFAGIRECYNRRAQDPAFERLTFCLLGVASPSDLIRDTRMTPFNIGRRIELTDFTETEAAPLAAGLGQFPDPAGRGVEQQAGEFAGVRKHSASEEVRVTEAVPAEAECFRTPASPTPLPGEPRARLEQGQAALLHRILYWTGGHPYLTQRLCQAIASDAPVATPGSVDSHCESLFLSPTAREKDDNLLFVRERLLRSETDLASLLDLYGQVHARKPVGADDTNPLIDLLRLAGIARVIDGRLRVRNRIYERVFDRSWVTTHMPDAELRRQRAAYRRGLVRATAVATAGMLVVLTLAFTALQQARRADRSARAEARSRDLAEQRSYAAAMNLAGADWESANIERLRRLLDQTRDSPYRGFEWYFWQRLCHLDRVTIQPHGDVAFFPPDDRRIALCADDRTVQVRDTATGRILLTLTGHTVPVQAIAIFPDNRRIFTAAWERVPAERVMGPSKAVRLEMRVWDAASGRVLSAVTETIGRPRELDVALEGPRVAIVGLDNTVQVQDPTTGRKLYALRGEKSAIRWLSLSRDGGRLLIGYEHGGAKLWDAGEARLGGGADSAGGRAPGTGRALLTVSDNAVLSPDGKLLLDRKGDLPWAKGQVLNATTGRVLANLGNVGCRGVTFSDDGRRLAIGGEGSIQIWDTHTWAPPLTFAANPLPVLALAFSRDGTRIATGGEDDTIRIWDVRTGRALLTLKGHRDVVHSVRFSSDGRRLVSESYDGVVKLWDVTSDHEALTLHHPAVVDAAVFSPDGRWIATGCRDGLAHVWDSRTGREIARFRAARSWLTNVTFSPNSQHLITGQGGIRVWDPATGRLICSILNPDLGGYSIAHSPDGKRFVARRWGSPPSVWDFATGRKLYTLRAPFPGEAPAAFSPNGRRIVTGSRGSAQGTVWDAATGRALLRLQSHEGKDGLLAVAYSPDGRRIVTTGWDRTARVWDAVTGRQLLVLRGHSRGVTRAAFSPDGKRIVTDSWDMTTRVWNAATGDELLTLKDTGGGTFSPDGRRLMAVSADATHTVEVWDIATPQQVAAWEAAERGAQSAKVAK